MLKKIILGLAAALVLLLTISAKDDSPPVSVGAGTNGVVAVGDRGLPTEIIVLPKFLVHSPDLPSFGPQEIYTKGGMDVYLSKRFPGASLKNQPREIDNYARLMYSDEVRLERLVHYGDLAEAIQISGDVVGATVLREELNRTFIRGHDWRTERMDRSANNNRR